MIGTFSEDNFCHIDHVVVIPFIKRRRIELSWYNRPVKLETLSEKSFQSH